MDFRSAGCATVAAAVLAALITGAPFPSAAARPSADDAIPRYRHIFVIMDENRNAERIADPTYAPRLTKLAAIYGTATQFFGEVHPSEANYVALLGGDTFGIHDDDAYACAPGAPATRCPGAQGAGYVDHTVDAPFLGGQLAAAGLTWKGYYESIPAPGSLATFSASGGSGDYASKHSGFLNFKAVQYDPKRAEHLVGFDRLSDDMATGALPSFALIVPNVCDDMHGASESGTPLDCLYANERGLIRRGDRTAAVLIAALQATPSWKSADNDAIVVTFDEDEGRATGCCGAVPGGGHIPTIVITNHGAHGLRDPHPYNHYALLRTIEDAFGIHQYLGHAADTASGVRPMLPLFAVTR